MRANKLKELPQQLIQMKGWGHKSCGTGQTICLRS